MSSTDPKNPGPHTDKPTKADRLAAAQLIESIREASERRTEWAFIVRESDTYSLSLFDGMRQQTLSPHREKPHVEAILNAGMAPWKAARNDTTFRVTMLSATGKPVAFDVPVISLQDKPKTLLFRFGDALHLWCMGSAALLGTDESVGKFNARLQTIIEDYWPRNLVVANVSRLVRSEALFHSFMSSIDIIGGPSRGDVRVEKVWSAEQTLNMKNFLDRFSLNFLAHHAEADLRNILQRTIAGRLVSASRGSWVPGNVTVPWGYKLDAQTKMLTCDPALQPKIEEMLRILATVQNKTDAIGRLSDLGMPMARKRTSDGERAMLSESGRPESMLFLSLLRLVPLYSHGEYLMRYANPGLHLDELAGYPVVRFGEGDSGEFQLLIKVPLPEGCWAPQEVLSRAEAVLRLTSDEVRQRTGQVFRPLHAGICSRSADPLLLEAMLPSGSWTNLTTRQGAAAHAQTPAFAGRQWISDETEFQLYSPNPNVYELRHRPARNKQPEVLA